MPSVFDRDTPRLRFRYPLWRRIGSLRSTCAVYSSICLSRNPTDSRQGMLYSPGGTPPKETIAINLLRLHNLYIQIVSNRTVLVYYCYENSLSSETARRSKTMLGRITHRYSIVIACNVLAFRDALRRLLAPEPDLEIVAEASDPGELAGILRRTSPEVVLCLFSLTDEEVVSTLQEVAARRPETRIVALVQSDPEKRQLLRNAFAGDVLVLRDVTIPEIVGAIRAGRQQGSVGIPEGHKAGPDAPHLTPREQQVISMLVQGFRTREIAATLAVSESTIHVYVHRLLKKYGVSRRLDLVVGFVVPDSTLRFARRPRRQVG